MKIYFDTLESITHSIIKYLTLNFPSYTEY